MESEMEYQAGGDSRSLDLDSARALVARTIRDVDGGSAQGMLLDDLLCAAWPSLAAQSQ